MPNILKKAMNAVGLKNSKAQERSEDDVWRIEVHTGSRWVPYPDKAALRVREAYLLGADTVNIEMHNRTGRSGRKRLFKYRVNFDLMQQINKHTARKRDIHFVKRGDPPRSGGSKWDQKRYDSRGYGTRSESRVYDTRSEGVETVHYCDAESHYEDALSGEQPAYSSPDTSSGTRRLVSPVARQASQRRTRGTSEPPEKKFSDLSLRQMLDTFDTCTRPEPVSLPPRAETRTTTEIITTVTTTEGSPSAALITLLQKSQDKLAEREQVSVLAEGTSVAQLRRHVMTINESDQYTADSLRTKINQVTEGVASGDVDFGELTSKTDGSELIEIRRRLLILARETGRLGFTDEEKQPLMILVRRIHCCIRHVIGNLLVFVRARPDKEQNNESKPTLRFAPGGTAIEVGDLGREKYLFNGATHTSLRNSNQEQEEAGELQKSYAFDAVFTDESQQEVYAEIRPLVGATHKGQNVGIACYGRTGAGKTFTMYGTQKKQGVIVRAIEQLFQLKEEKSKTHDVKMTCSVAEIYQNNVIDLLNLNDAEASTDFFQFEKTCKKENIDTISDFHSVMEKAFKRRLTAALGPSKCSHLAIKTSITLVDKATKAESKTCLSMVDLAGSERVAATDRKAIREGNEVNKALASLGSAIEKLASPEKAANASALMDQSHVLTDLLHECFTGNSKFLFITNISQCNQHSLEDLASLNFACRVADMKKKVSSTAA